MENKKEKVSVLKLFTTFFRIGIMTFGGGLTMLPLLKHEIVEKNKWCSEEQLLDCYAVGQCTPGIIAVNTATYVGYLKAGVAGGALATAGMVAPSIIIITIVAAFLRPFMDNIWLQHALAGVRGIVCALMFHTVISLAKKSWVHAISIVLTILVFILAAFTSVPTILLVVITAVFGILVAPHIVKKEAK